MSMSVESDPGSRDALSLTRDLALPALGLLVLAFQLYRQRYFFHDDEFIALRYALNLINHGQLVWNLGEPVEGYTNFLHLILTSGLMRSGLDPVVAARTVNGVAAVGLVAATLGALRVLSPGRDNAIFRAISMFSLLCMAPLALWILGGLEPVLAAAFVAAACLVIAPATVRPPTAWQAALAGLLFAAAALTRPDALLLMSGAVLLLAGPGPGPRRTRLVALGSLLASTGVVLTAQTLWRLGYYHDLLPNTFYAKVGVPLLQRLTLGALYLPMVLLLLPVCLVAGVVALYVIARRIATPAIVWLAVSVAVFAAYIVWAGGDHMAGGRLLVPALGPATMLLSACLARLDRRTALRAGAFCGGLSLVMAVIFPVYKMDEAGFVGTIVGEYARRTWPKGTLVALHTAGSTPYTAPDLRYIDMLGLNDRHIAHRNPTPILTRWQLTPGHAKGDGAYVLKRAPAIIILGPAAGTSVERPWFLTDEELRRDPRFLQCYAKRVVPLDYSDAFARRADPNPRPLPFTYYERVCPPPS